MTGLIGIALTVFLVGAVGLYLLLGAAIFVTHLVEKRPLRFLVPAQPDDPEWSRLPSHASKQPVPPVTASDNPYAAPGAAHYAEAQNAAAERLGFVPSGLCAHAKGGTYKTHSVIWVSPTRETLAFVGWGTIAAINADKTILYSALDDGRFLVTSAKPTGAETPGFYENVVVMGATFERLVQRHDDRLRQCGRGLRLFQADDPLTDYEAIQERQKRFLIEKGDAYLVKPNQTAIRSTLKGALKAYLRTLRPAKGIEREGTPLTAGGKPVYPAPLVWFEWFCYMSIFAGAILNARGRATTGPQQLFRLALFVGGLAGLFLVFILKAVFKRRAR